jgi:hypothetical protein
MLATYANATDHKNFIVHCIIDQAEILTRSNFAFDRRSGLFGLLPQADILLLENHCTAFMPKRI